MLRRGAALPGSLLRRNFSTSRVTRSSKRLNLTLYASPILLRLHPDTVQRQMPALAQENEEALKHLNVFLELATFGCNNDAFNARKHVLALSESRQVSSEEPVRFPLVFHVPVNDFETLEHVDGFLRVKYIIEVPGRLVKRTLSNLGRLVSARDPEAALQAPFAREWQRTTKRILLDLFEVAHVPLVVTEEDNVRTTALEEWLAEEATIVGEADMHGIYVGEQNRATKREHEQFDNMYHVMLTHEKNIVHETTTGLEDGPTTQHAVLTSLLHSRLFLPKFRDPHMKKSAFHWIANFLLVNFMELRLHSLVWNKVTLLITADTDVKEPQVSWDEEAPEEGMGILVPVGMDVDTLIDFMYENVEDLEFALEKNSLRDQATVKEKQRLRREMKKKKGKQKRRGHFYQDESDTAVLTMPTVKEVPSDVAATLSAYSAMAWNDLNDITKVGLLWVHGYVFSGGSTNGEKAGDAVIEVYTRCADGATTGVAMVDVGITYDEFTGGASQCEVASCGSYYQATNVNCVANVRSTLKCAINGALTTLQPARNTSFWSSAASASTIPYPQAFQHNITLTNNTAALQVYSIHMRNDDACVLSGNALDTIIPCLRLEDMKTTGSNDALRFCKPIVDAARMERFLGLTRTVQMIKQLSADTSSDGDSEMDLTRVAETGGGVLFVLLVMGIICCCCRKSKLRNAGQTPEITMVRTSEERSPHAAYSANATRTGPGFIPRVIGRCEANTSHNSLNIATNVNMQTNRGRISSWYTIGNPSRRESTVYGRLSSMIGTRMGTGVGGKTVSEYCSESETLTNFMQDPEIFNKRIAFDELTFLRILSSGAYGEVWLGQLETRHVAIKRLLPEKCQFTASLEQFAGEIQLMCTLQHRSIVSFIGVSWNRLQNLCAVVEYMDAGDLDEVLKKNREKFTWQCEKISIAISVAEGLAYLHSLRPAVVHRDLKSKNVLLNRTFHAKLSDFGVSRKTHVNETMTSGVGTLLWTAPEIIEGKKYSEKADIYSLGVVLSETDTCEAPFSDVTSDKGERLPGMQLAQLVRLGEIRVSLRKECPPALRKMIMDCTQLDPESRPSSMQVAFTLKSIIAPTLRMSSSTATTALTCCYPSSESHTTASQV
ncbi:unnamed protein product [Peronospora destructor]|uniref:Protein kinase domain-containing protein n=1 Tax=Peronospora destructor TaxID=86335 RepID=A0AAV0UKU2_9STRA|nr:unnamed protein product [Peronospora destructor]